MIPTPAGVTDIPPGLDEETARKLQVEVEEERPEKVNINKNQLCLIFLDVCKG